jgi:hypothetical protein
MAASIAPECNDIKEYALEPTISETEANKLVSRKYDTCFLKWYSESTFSFPCDGTETRI